MKLPISWLSALVDLDGVTTEDIAQALTMHTAAVEKIESTTEGISGPVVIGKVLSCVDEPQKNGKVIRWCRVDVGPEHNDPATAEIPASRGIVCGAHNFKAEDYVIVSLPGAVLPGDFEIAARKTYGHVSDGMICSAMELNLGEDHDGIIVLPEVVNGAPLVLGADALDALGLRDEVLEVDVTPDIGYCLSIRGLAREVAQILGKDFADPYLAGTPSPRQDGYPVVLEDSAGCSQFVAISVTGVNPLAPTPDWMVRRLQASGMRSISLAVDVTNYVMLEAGQPLHAYDADKLSGPIVVRSAKDGETITTIDHVERSLSTQDLLICDDSGPIGIAGVMGGIDTEINEATTNVVLEAAFFDPKRIGRTFRAHNLGSEASRRFEKGVDPALQWAANRKAAELLAEFGGGEISPDVTIAGVDGVQPSQQLDLTLPGRIIGMEIPEAQVREILSASGVEIAGDGHVVNVDPPTWRFDLVDPYDYVEEIARKIGFDSLPQAALVAPAGRGLSRAQQLRRKVMDYVVANGFVETISLPFVGEAAADAIGAEQLIRIANPLDDTMAYLRPSLLPGLFAAVSRNISRNNDDLALFEYGSVFFGDDLPPAPHPSVTQRPTAADLAAYEKSLPSQPKMLAAIVTGYWMQPSWQGAGVKADWRQVFAFADLVATSLGLRIERATVANPTWHTGRCAKLFCKGQEVGIAGELHPRTIEFFELPTGTCAVELNLDLMISLASEHVTIPTLSNFPLVKQDVALVIPSEVPAADVQRALVEGAGELLESIALFDIYTGPQVGEGNKSLAFNLHFRSDRTLKDSEVAEARQSAVDLAADRFGAALRS